MSKTRSFAYIRPVLVALAVMLGYLAAPAQILAADASTNISISPLTFDLSANRGDTLTNEILVRNSGSSPVVLNPEAQDFVAEGEEGQISLTEARSTYSLASWIQLDTSPITLNGGQQQRIKFIIRIPSNAEPGGHYASVFAHIGPTLSAATSGSGVGQKIGALISLRVAGNAKEEAKINSFTTTKSSYQHGPIDFDVRVLNSGSVHIKPMGVIAITDSFGKKVGSITVDQKNILPGAVRHLSASWAKPPAFGKFSATLLALYGTDNKQITAVTTFWIIPWKTIGIWAGIVIACMGLLWLTRRRIKNAIKAFLDKK